MPALNRGLQNLNPVLCFAPDEADENPKEGVGMLDPGNDQDPAPPENDEITIRSSPDSPTSGKIMALTNEPSLLIATAQRRQVREATQEFFTMIREGRVDLLELCASATSPFADPMARAGGRYHGLGIFNGVGP